MVFLNNTLTLNYDYIQGNWSWDTGFSAMSWAMNTVSNRETLIRGDDMGWIWRAEAQEGEGGLIYSVATSAASTTLTDTTQTFTVDVYAGVYIEILSGTGSGQRRLISSNTATQVTITEAWTTTPDTTSYYTIGGIDFYYLHAWNDYDAPGYTKNLKIITPWIEASANFDATGFVGYDLKTGTFTNMTITVSVNAAWDADNWDEMYWDDAGIDQDRKYTSASQIHTWSAFGVKHKKAGIPFKLKGYTKIFQIKGLGIRT